MIGAQKRIIKTIFLHIGFPKTGTTTIQNFFTENNALLLNQSCLYPILQSGDTNHLRMSRQYNDFRCFDLPTSIENKLTIVDQIKLSTCDKVILSGECFVYEDPKLLKSFFQLFEVKIVVAIRDCYSYASSFLKEIVKTGNRKDVFWLETMSFMGKIEDYIDEFGFDNIIFINYNKVADDKCLICTFLEACCINNDDKFVYNNYNVTPSDAATMFLYQVSFLPLEQDSYKLISEQVLEMDLSSYDSYKCSLIEKSFLEDKNRMFNVIQRQAELLHVKEWPEFCEQQRQHFLSITNTDLPPHIQYYIFSKLSKEAQDLILSIEKAAKIEKATDPILPSMQNIPEKYFKMLVDLRAGFITQSYNFFKSDKTITIQDKEIFQLKNDINVLEEKNKQANIDIEKFSIIIKQFLENYDNFYNSRKSRAIRFFRNLLLFDNNQEILYIKSTQLFDSWYYLENHTPLENTNINLLQHYFLIGAKEGRNPCPWFSTSKYLEKYVDVKYSGMNPFYHYCRYGFKEGREFFPV